MAVWTVSGLTAVDERGRVVKDEYGALVVDPRNRRIRGYRQRWCVDGPRNQHNRSFARNERTEAERFHALLVRARDTGAPAGPDGTPVVDDTPPPRRARTPGLSAPGRLTTGAALDRFWQAVSPRWSATNTKTFHRLNVDFARAAVGDLPFASLSPGDCQDLLLARRNTNLRTRGQNERAEAAWKRRWQAELDWADQAGGEPVLPAPPGLRGEAASVRTERGFGVTMGLFFRWAAATGLRADDPWPAAVADVLRSGADTVVTPRMVPTVDRLWDLADAVARQDGGRGERFRVPVLFDGHCALRPGELAWQPAAGLLLDRPEPVVVVSGSEVTVSARDSAGGLAREERPLKHRLAGSEREVPILPALVPELRRHVDVYCKPGGRLFTWHNGGPVDYHNLSGRYWEPAVAEVFGGSDNPWLRNMPFRWLRKTAITWWLTSGIDPYTAAGWAGHDAATLLRYYASRPDRGYAPELAKLQTTSTRPSPPR